MLIGYSKLPYYIYSEHFKWFIIALYVILLSTKKRLLRQTLVQKSSRQIT